MEDKSMEDKSQESEAAEKITSEIEDSNTAGVLEKDQGFTKKFSSQTKILVLAGLIILVAALWWTLGSGGSLADQEENLPGEEQVAAAATAAEVAELLEEVGKLMLLPEGEEPLVATVVDPESLALEQPFYANVQKDDRLIIYPSILKAILYRPSSGIIVNVGPVQVQDDQAQ